MTDNDDDNNEARMITFNGRARTIHMDEDLFDELVGDPVLIADFNDEVEKHTHD